MAFFFVATVLLLFLFAFVDVWYFTRYFANSFYLAISRRDRRDRLTKEDVLRTFITRHIVLPSDIDLLMHMNNAKYLREFDLSRMITLPSTGVIEVIHKNGGYIVVNAGNIRYRRPMKLFQRYIIETRTVGWDDNSFYIEQRMKTSDGFVTAILLTKLAVRGISVGEVIKEMLGEVISSPELSPEMKTWLNSIEISSKTLRAEAGLYKTPSYKELATVSLQR